MREYKASIEHLQLTQDLPASFYPSIELAPHVQTEDDQAPIRGTPSPTGGRKRNPETAYTKCFTIDSAQGQESFMVIMDGSFQVRTFI